MPISLWVEVDSVFRIADVNDAGCEFSGMTREQMVGASAQEVGGNAVRAKRDMLTASSRDQPVTRELTHMLPNGELRRMDVLYVRVAPGQVLAFVHDLTWQRATEERLRVSEGRYKALVAAANEGVWLVDHSGRTTFANGKVAHILGRSADEVVEGNLLDFVDPRDRAVVAGAIECPRDTPAAFEARFRHSRGGELLCLLSVSPISSEGRTPSTLCVIADMTMLQRERELRTISERRFRHMVETTSEGVWTGDKEGRTTFVNRAAARMIGLDPEEMIGRSFADFVAEPDEAADVHERIARDHEPVRGEFRLARGDGKPIDVIASVSLLRDDDDQIIGSLAVVSDVTQMKREQADLRESRERFAQVYEEAPVGIVFIAAGRLVRGKFIGANRAFRAMLGYSDEELVEHDILSVTHPDDVDAERVLAHELFEHERDQYELDKRFVGADGEVVWARFRAHVLRDERGAPLYGLGVAVDITAERAAHALTRDAVARTRAVFESTPDAVLELAADGTVVQLNDAAVRMFGVERRAVVGAPLAETFVPARLRARFAEAFADWLAAARVGRQIEPTETTLARADGSDFPATMTITAVEGVSPPLLTLYVRNLGVQDRAEAARREADERFQRLFHDAPAPVAVIDMQGRLTDVNEAFCKLAGVAAADLVGHDATAILGDAGDAHEAPWQHGTERPGPLCAARRLQHRNGRSTIVQVTASLVRDTAGMPIEWICQCAPRALAEAPPLPGGEPLSYRERQVLGLLAHGHDGPAIADRLGLSPETVRSYAGSARDKLGAKTRTEAVALALMRGEITL